MAKIKGSTWFLMLFMAAMLGIIFYSLQMEYFQSKILPLIIAGAIVVLGAIRLVKEIRLGNKLAQIEKAYDEDTEETQKTRPVDFLINGAWVGGFVLAVYLVGFLITVPLYVIASTKTHGVKWRTSIVTAVALTVVCYALFTVALQVSLYKGIILYHFLD